MNDALSGWKWDKTLNLPMVGAVLLQSAAIVWWVSQMSYRVEALEKETPQLSQAVERLNTAREDLRLSLQAQTASIEELRTVLSDRTQRFDEIQQSLVRIEHKTHNLDGDAPTNH